MTSATQGSSTTTGLTGAGVPGQYGYSHRGRIIRAAEVSGTYFAEVPTVSPGSKLGPFPAVIPGLAAGDRVLLTQVGMTRGDLVIVGKLPGDFPSVGEVTGLDAALAAKANESDLSALTTRVGTDETAITANGSAIVALQGRATTDEAAITANATAIGTNATAISGLGTRLTTDETAITALTVAQRLSYGNDYDIDHDYVSTLARAFGSSALSLPNGLGIYAAMYARQAFSLAKVKFCINTAGAGGVMTLGLWHGPSAAALTYVGAFTANATVAGRQTWTLGTPPAIAAGDRVVVGFLVTGMTSQPTLAANPPVNANMFNEDASSLTCVETTATLTALPTSALNMATTSGYNLALGQIPWVAASP